MEFSNRIDIESVKNRLNFVKTTLTTLAQEPEHLLKEFEGASFDDYFLDAENVEAVCKGLQSELNENEELTMVINILGDLRTKASDMYEHKQDTPYTDDEFINSTEWNFIRSLAVKASKYFLISKQKIEIEYKIINTL